MDERADLYALGVVLFEMATGRKLFEGETVGEVLEQHLHDAPTDPRKLNPDIRASLSRLILRCLEKDPDSRFSSASELRQALRELA